MCRRFGSSLPLLIVASCALAPLLVSLCGCGGSNTEGGKPGTGYTEERKITEGLLTALSDPETSVYVFVKGKASQAELETLAKYKYHAEPDDVALDASGKSATITVQTQDSGGNSVGETVQWKAVKQGNEWMLESAPLPAAAK
ncbi:MAG: hypothetical protein HQ567_30700 [Candidatus Nealsonbacteria bacterium]|nr:hypothetical protein [Candidatus Nealsonbacteria bacterium]